MKKYSLETSLSSVIYSSTSFMHHYPQPQLTRLRFVQIGSRTVAAVQDGVAADVESSDRRMLHVLGLPPRLLVDVPGRPDSLP